MKITFFIYIICILEAIHFSQQTIQQLHIVFRHGERTPTDFFHNDPNRDYFEKNVFGQLTNKGKYQLYSLGLLLRKEYNNTIPEYYKSNDVEVLSSYSDRCIMSAQLLLAGLFPPLNDQIWNQNLLWQPIPVKDIPRNEDKIMAMKAPCRKYDIELKHAFTSGIAKNLDKDNAELYQYLTEHTGNEINSILDVESLYNTLEIELLHNLTLPTWIEMVSMDTMRELASWSLATFTSTTYMKRMKGGAFLNKTINDMKQHFHTPMLHLYSAHDITLVNILRTLDAYEILKPGFGACIIIELHQNQEIRIFYRDAYNKDRNVVKLRRCSSPCFLKMFEKSLDDLLPKNWNDECDN